MTAATRRRGFMVRHSFTVLRRLFGGRPCNYGPSWRDGAGEYDGGHNYVMYSSCLSSCSTWLLLVLGVPVITVLCKRYILPIPV